MRILHTFLLLILLVAPGLGQTLIDILPNEGATIVGEICFLDLDYPGTIDLVCIKAPNNVTTDFDITLPAAPPAGTECMQMSNTGVISTSGGACGGSGDVHPIIDTTPIVEGSVDATKEFRLEVDALVPTTTTVVATVPSASFTFAGLELTQTFTQINTFSSAINLNSTVQASDSTIEFGDSFIVNTDSTHDIGTNAVRFRWGFADVWNAEKIEIEAADHAAHWRMELNVSDHLLVTDPGDILAFTIEDSATGNMVMSRDIIMSSQDIRCTGTCNLGSVTSDFAAVWASGTVNAGILEIIGNDTAGSGEGPQLIEITKDGAGTIEADNFAISGDGNFYIRSFTGDVDCNTSSVDDGWIGVQTTAEEIQFCSGFATRLSPSVPTSFAPVTVNCAAGEVILDPRYENGILVEGSCGAN
jgi:hypothetical protein